MHRYLLVLENGEPADPPAFVSEEKGWEVGDLVVARGNVRFRVLAITEPDDDFELHGFFDAVWTVRLLD